MKNYCLDTSGLSNPLENMPEDIHESLWAKICEMVTDGVFAVTLEIYQELTHLPGDIGQCIKDNKANLLLEIGDDAWKWKNYVDVVTEMQETHKKFISEYNKNRKRTIGLNDLSIIAMAKTLDLKLISMEKPILDANSSCRRIPDICQAEHVEHITFSEFLRLEGVKL